MIKKICSIICLFILLLNLLMLCACSNLTSTSNLLSSNSNESTMIEENDYYKVTRSENLTYYYTIFDKNHNVAKTGGPLNKQPNILLADDSLVKFTLQAGTGITTQWGYYYDIETGDISEEIYGILDQNEGKVAYVDKTKIVVRDIFDSEKYYYEISSFTQPLSTYTVEPIKSAKFVNNGESLEVSYVSGKEYSQITEIIDLM